jgi:hemolysin III
LPPKARLFALEPAAMLATAQPQRPSYTRRERAADAAVHAIGGAAAVLGCGVLAVLAEGARAGVALGLYGFGLLAMYGCSAAYNLAPAGPWHRVLRRLDHAAIFLMIAGTYTPVVLLGFPGEAFGVAVLALVWAGALGGACLKLAAPGRFERLSLAAYLLLGWLGLAGVPRLMQVLPTVDLALLLAGGLIYSLGVPLHLARGLRYHNALWHGCVLVASACHFVLVLHLAGG